MEVSMATVTVKSIPEALYEQLKQAAQLHRRSINSEIIVCIEQAMGGQPIDLEMTLARAQVLRERTLAYPISDEAFTEAKTAGRA
jgi:plasmid stability protein